MELPNANLQSLMWDDETIYCLAPRQLPGGNHIKVVVEDKEVITDATFEYEQAQNVSTIAGSQNVRKI